jgi:hypothetical protein
MYRTPQQNSTPRNYPREIKKFVQNNNHTRIFVAALFMIAPNWTQLKLLSTGERKGHHTVYLYSGILLSNKKE